MNRRVPLSGETPHGGLPRPGFFTHRDTSYSLAPLVPWRILPRPIAWDQVFGRSAPLHVELGFGLGDYLVRTALAEPDINHVGIEIGWPLVRRTLQKVTRAGAGHVALIQAGAAMAMERLFREQSIDLLWAVFPCPWPKARHARKRIFSRSFLRLMNSRLVPAGKAFVVTDDPDHARWIVAESAGTGFCVQDETVPPQFDTRYEKEWKRKGQDRFYRIRFQKERHFSVPLKEETPVQTRIVSTFSVKDLPSEPVKGGRSTVVPKDALYDRVQERAMVRALILEPDFSQDIWIEIARRPSGWHIRPAKGCNMIPTPGVQEALDLLHGAILAKEAAPSPGDHPVPMENRGSK